MLRIILASLLATVAVAIPAIDGDCKSCDKSLCMPFKQCTGGYIMKDKCNCCDICVKTREREVCGGIQSMLGKCGDGLICQVRHPNSFENRLLPPDAMTGKCEPVACKNVKCGKHQWCSVKNDTAKCDCHINCSGKPDFPVCGIKDGKNYRNRCMVRKVECELQKDIGYLPGECKLCRFKNNLYKYGETIDGGERCEKCTCKHGHWNCKYNIDCLKKEFYAGYECTGYTNLHNPISCPEGYECKYETTSEDISGIPALGRCIPIDPAVACVQKPVSGSCFGYFKVWFYDVSSQKCKIFVYGGCDGNHNRFQTKEACMNVCRNVTRKPEPPAPVGPKKPVVPPIPVVPKVPDIPKVPETVVPKVPSIPKVPEVPRATNITKDSNVSKVPIVPELPPVENLEQRNEKKDPAPKAQEDMCTFGEKKYKIGETFIDEGCSGVCKCSSATSFSCVSLCPPMGIVCPTGTRKVQYQKPLEGTPRCSCPDYKCVKEDECFYQGKTYNRSTSFINEECTEQCLCGDDGNITCISLCAAVAAFGRKEPCPKHQKMILSKFVLPGEPRCSCPLPVCYNDNDVCSLQSDSGPCFGFMKRWFFNNETGNCEEFTYGGCRGNKNNFQTKTKCIEHCLFSDKKAEPVVEKSAVGKISRPDVKPKNETELIEGILQPPILEPIEGFTDNEFPFGGGPYAEPEYGNETMKILGKVKFNRIPGKLPSPSCLVISFQDVAMQDAASVTYSEVTLDVANVTIGNEFPFEMESRKPAKLHTFFSVSATLNIGWCPANDSQSWLQHGDYLTDTTHYIPMGSDKNEYEVDLEMKYYCRRGACSGSKKSEKKKVFKPVAPVKPDMDVEINGPEYSKRIDEAIEAISDEPTDVLMSRIPSVGNETIVINGFVNFTKSPGKLPSPSCLKIEFEDISLQDVASIMYEEEEFNVSGEELGKYFEYKLETKKPENLAFTYSVSAVLNVGWCADADSKSWVRNKDFLSVSTVTVPLKKEQNRYQVDIPAVYYCRGKSCKQQKAKPKTNESTQVEQPKIAIAGSLLSADNEPKNATRPVFTLPPFDKRTPPPVPVMPKCIDAKSEKEYFPGEEWYGDDDCMHCTCRTDGEAACMTPMCGLPFCARGPAIKIKGRCCPVCPDDVTCKDEKQRAKVEGFDRWQRDDCQVCHCTRSGIACVDPKSIKQSCKRKALFNPRCEHICIDDILPRIEKPKPEGCFKRDGSSTPFGSRWSIDNCTTCTCSFEYGVRCNTPTCEHNTYNCEKLIDEPGECCPRCELKKCLYRYTYFSQNERIVKKDQSTVCRCQNGEWFCDKEKKKCKDNKGLEYLLGQTRKQDCNICICSGNGQWACTAIACPIKV